MAFEYRLAAHPDVELRSLEPIYNWSAPYHHFEWSNARQLAKAPPFTPNTVPPLHPLLTNWRWWLANPIWRFMHELSIGFSFEENHGVHCEFCDF